MMLLVGCVFPSLPGAEDDDAACVPPFCVGGRFDDTDDGRDSDDRDPEDRPDDEPDTGDVVEWGDTGLAMMWYLGDGRADAGTWLGGSFGLGFFAAGDDEALCEAIADWYDAGEEPLACPDCEWAFTLGMRDTEAQGEFCADFGIGDGVIDGWTYQWAFADTFEYGGDQFTNALLFAYDDAWYLFAMEDYGVYGDAQDFSFQRYSGAYYYYYR